MYKTYRDVAVEKLMSIGINHFEATQIVSLIEEGEYAPHVFSDFAEHWNDDWDAEVQYTE